MNKDDRIYVRGILLGLGLGAIILVLLALFVSCINIRLEDKLAPKVKDWLDIHSVLMQYPVPPEVSPKKMTEYSYFLHLSPALQLQYIYRFWGMRYEYADIKDNFYARLNWCDRIFRVGKVGWKTDRGQLFLLLGEPDDVCFRSVNRVDSGSTASSTAWMDEGTVQIWTYFFYGQMVSFYFFKGIGEDWHSYYAIGLPNTQGQESLIQWAQWWQAPTEEGWLKWKEFLEGQVQGENAKEVKKLLKKMRLHK